MRTRVLIILAIFLLAGFVARPLLASPDVAFDAFKDGAANSTGDLTWTHFPVGTPRAIIVLVTQHTGTADEVSGVTYGGVSMTEACGPNIKTSTEVMGTYAYFLGSSIPSGNQTVTVSTTGTTGTRRGASISLTASADTEVVDCDATISSDSVSDPSVTLSLGGRTSFAAIQFGAGQNVVTNITPLTNWSTNLEVDFGSQTAGWYTYDTIGTTDVTAGWDNDIADDAVAIALAVSEVQGGAPAAEVKVPDIIFW